MADVIAVRPQDTLATLLAEIGSRPDRSLVLWVPRGTQLLRQMEDYQALKDALRQHHAQLKILSADARIVGLAMVFGIEAEISPTPPAGTPAAAVLTGGPDQMAAPAGLPMTPPPVPPGPITAPLGRPPQPPPIAATIAVPAPSAPEPDAGVSESDWLLDDEANLTAILDADDLTRSRSAMPPPDVLAGFAASGLVPTGAAPPPPPAAPRVADSPAALATAATDTSPVAAPRRPAEPAEPVPAPTTAPHTGAAPPAGHSQPVAAPVKPSPPPGPINFPPPESNGTRSSSRRRNEGIPFTLDPAPPPAAAAPSVPSAPVAPSPAPPRHPAPAPVWASADDDDGPAMTFAEWIAREAAASGAAAPGATLPPDVDLERLPAWLRESLARAEPLPPAPPTPPPAAATSRKPFQPGAINPLTGRPATGPLFPPDEERVPPAPVPRSSAVLRCPHCGEELDKEQMLRMLAEVWGL